MNDTPRIGILGGSGIYDMEALEVQERVTLTTPFGAPSDEFVLGSIDGRAVAFLPRHGAGHRLLPGEINYRANICGMKMLGVERIVSFAAVGSLKENIHPMEAVVPDQFIDRTHGRADTFFGDGVVAHVAFGDPTCDDLRCKLAEAARECGVAVHDGGTYICMQGPAFSTRAESRLYRSWGADVVGMTNLTEAKLAREAEMCYATLAFVTDYDCWHEGEEDVTVEMLVNNLHQNADAARRVVRTIVAALPAKTSCACGQALASGLFTPPDAVPPEARERLAPIIGKYL